MLLRGKVSHSFVTLLSRESSELDFGFSDNEEKMTADGKEKEKKNSRSNSCSSLLNSSPYLSLVCMVSIMATILVLSSSGKEFNSCGSIIILYLFLV